MKMYQCLLRRGDEQMTAWISERGAKLGVQVELMPDHEWWRVVRVYTQHPLPDDTLREYQRLNRKSLPSVDGMT